MAPVSQNISAKRRIHPTCPAKELTTVALSILDASVARYSPTGATFVFDSASEAASSSRQLLLDHLLTSLTVTLNQFPQWAGQLQWTPVGNPEIHSERFNRPILVYGTDNDPGIEWSVVKQALRIRDIHPSPSDKDIARGSWIVDGFPQDELHSQTPLALHNLSDYKDLPSMLVHINLFEEGGYAISVKMSHCLADAQSLLIFVHRWAAQCRSLFNNPTPCLVDSPIFNPSLLDRAAAGNLDGTAADQALLDAALDLPIHRYDWWDTSAPGYPPFLRPSTLNSKPTDPQLLAKASHTPAAQPPWTTRKISNPVSNAIAHFSPAQLSTLRESAGQQVISRLEALLSHLWQRINLARGVAGSTEPVCLNVTLGARTRLAHPLPETFLGSPLFLTHITAPASEVCASNVGDIAIKLRRTMVQFTPEKVGVLLHSLAHEASPQRLWQGFLGERHLLVTSWLRLGVYEVDFEGCGMTPRYVHSYMPKMDGCLQVTDATDGGMDVSIHLETAAMMSLLS